jgi:large subunit ribosomal protein L4
MSVPTFTKAGAKATTPAKLNKDVFGVEIANHELLKLAYSAYLSNGRDNLAVTKTRGLISGGGRKPWKQKGTGRARFGSSRNPIWRGGGIVFGPTGEENYTKRVSVTAKRQALRQALTLAATDGTISVIESFDANDGKSAQVASLLKKVGAKGRVVIIVDTKDDKLVRATGNVPNVSVVSAAYVNVYDVLNSDTIIVTEKALEVINTWLAPVAAKGGKA